MWLCGGKLYGKNRGYATVFSNDSGEDSSRVSLWVNVDTPTRKEVFYVKMGNLKKIHVTEEYLCQFHWGRGCCTMKQLRDDGYPHVVSYQLTGIRVYYSYIGSCSFIRNNGTLANNI